MNDLREQTIQQLKNLKARKEAPDNLLRYLQLQMLDPNKPNVMTEEGTRYVTTPQAMLLCQIMEKVERGEMQRVAVSIGPQLGKSDIISRGFPAWAAGRNPYANIMLGTYNQTFAEEFGAEVMARIQSPMHQAIFPKHKLDKSAASLLITPEGGKTAFVGVGGSGTGKPADFFLVDDPIRSDEDAQSQLYRDRIWKWFTSVVFTRCHSKSAIVVVHCLTGDTRVTMADHTRKRMDQIVPGDEVLAWEDGRHVAKKVLNAASQGEDDVLDIRTGSSRVRANARHPFAVMRHGQMEWVKAGDLAVGDLVVTSAVEQGAEEKLTPEEAWLLGFMFGDGWITERTGVHRQAGQKERPRVGLVLCAALCGNEEYDMLFEQAFEKKFGFVPKRTKYGYWRTERQDAARWFKEHGLAGTAKTKVLPQWLFQQTLEVRRAFVEGLHWTDGTTDKKKQSNIAVSNEALLRDVRDLARSVGICVSNVYACTALVQPPNSKAPVRSTIWSFKWGVREVEEAFHVKPITKIVPAGREEVFDIQVEGAENFIADGMVTHNTRWNADDLIGRLCDPDHPERHKEYEGIADDWVYINLPAVVDDPELAEKLGLKLEVQTEKKIIAQFGEKPISALWPGRKGLKLLAEAKRMDPRTFGALYMGQPSAEDGEYFKAEWLVEYDPHELPMTLQKFGASDHAVSTKAGRDPTVLGCVGIDEHDVVWVLPDVVMDRMQTDRTVEEMIAQFKIHKPNLWWMESELISKSFGPFLTKRMLDERVYTTIDPVTPSKDKQTRARAIQGRLSMKQVRFPRFATWWNTARAQMLGFPYAAHDDFVDWLAHIGMGILKERGPIKERAIDNVIRVGSAEWILRSAYKKAQTEKRDNANAGW